MKKSIAFSTAALSLGFCLLVLNGCGSAPSSTPSSAPERQSATAEDSDDHGDHGHHSHDDGSGRTDMEKMKAELAKLSPEDAASAEKQHVCPVTGEMLGTMGAPIKVDVDGRQVWICCKGCRKKLLNNPDKYLANLVDL